MITFEEKPTAKSINDLALSMYTAMRLFQFGRGRWYPSIYQQWKQSKPEERAKWRKLARLTILEMVKLSQHRAVREELSKLNVKTLMRRRTR